MKTRKLKLGFLFSSIALTLVMCIFIFSCQKEEVVSNYSSFDYDQIGVEHNKGLDYVFEQLKQTISSKKSNLKSTYSMLSIAENATIDFLSSNSILEDANKQIAIIESQKVFNIYSQDTSLKLKNVSTNNIWPDEVDSILTTTQKQLLTEIDIIVSNQELNLQTSLDKLDMIKQNVELICVSDEKPIVMSAISIASHSLQYWHDNYENWVLELNPNDSLATNQIALKSADGGELISFGFHWKDVAKNDIAYGIGGGAAGAIVGGSVSFGILTLPGWAAGALGGAVGGSVGNAALQILDLYW